MKALRLYIAAVSVLLLASCGASKKQVVRPAERDIVAVDQIKPSRHNGDPGFDVNSSLADKIIKSARKWLGTPYRYGGNDRKGTDCSGMTMRIFGDVAGIALPRNSAKQYEYCISIGREDLQPGDLVFFSGNSKSINHVGLYIGDRKMIHASSSKGVVESSLDENYWLNHYYGSGRVNAVTYAMSGSKPSQAPVEVVPEVPAIANELPQPEIASEPQPTPEASVPTAEDINDAVKAAFSGD